jgi:hypothetical protein
MIEVFKTNIDDVDKANGILHEIERKFPHYHATFDLSDCDRILRVECKYEHIRASLLINLIHAFGFHAEVLQEEDFPVKDF